MAHKRMFSKDITGSDAFREMPTSSQSLYFHIGMEADDDGFLDSFKGLMRSVGVGDDDLKILLGKRFILPRDGGVMLVKHWLINNTIRKDRYTPTRHTEAKDGLYIKENKAYTMDEMAGKPIGNHLATQDRIGKDRIVGVSNEPIEIVSFKEKEEPRAKTKPKYPNARTVFKWFPKQQPSWSINTTELKHGELLFERGEEQVKKALEFYQEYKDEDFCPQITKPSDLERKWTDLINFKKKHEC